MQPHGLFAVKVRMKRVKLLVSAGLLQAAIMSGCLKDSTTPVIVINQSMKIKINGTGYHYNSCTASDVLVSGNKQTIITGVNLDGNVPASNNMELDIMHDISTLKEGDVFHVTGSPGQINSMTLYYFRNDSDSYVTQPKNPWGAVTITSVADNVITGNFSAKVFAPD